MIRNTDTWKPNESKVITESEATMIKSQDTRLERWTEYSREQFNWLKAAVYVFTRSCK